MVDGVMSSDEKPPSAFWVRERLLIRKVVDLGTWAARLFEMFWIVLGPLCQ